MGHQFQLAASYINNREHQFLFKILNMKLFTTLLALATAGSCVLAQSQSGQQQYGPGTGSSYGGFSGSYSKYIPKEYLRYFQKYWHPKSFAYMPEPEAASMPVGASIPFMPSFGGMGPGPMGPAPMGPMGPAPPMGYRPMPMPMPMRPMGGGMMGGMGGGMFGGGIPFMGGLGSICNFPMHSEFAMPPWCMDHPYPF